MNSRKHAKLTAKGRGPVVSRVLDECLTVTAREGHRIHQRRSRSAGSYLERGRGGHPRLDRSGGIRAQTSKLILLARSGYRQAQW